MEISAGMRSSLNEDESVSANEEYSGIVGGMEGQYVTSIKKSAYTYRVGLASSITCTVKRNRHTIACWHYSLGATRILYYFSCCESA